MLLLLYGVCADSPAWLTTTSALFSRASISTASRVYRSVRTPTYAPPRVVYVSSPPRACTGISADPACTVTLAMPSSGRISSTAGERTASDKAGKDVEPTVTTSCACFRGSLGARFFSSMTSRCDSGKEASRKVPRECLSARMPDEAEFRVVTTPAPEEGDTAVEAVEVARYLDGGACA